MTFTGKVTFESVHDLVKTIDSAVNYYFFKKVKIEINSPGGELKALQLFISKLQEWRAKGVVIETHAMCNVASAAAVMLSLGNVGYRTAMKDSEILYHNVRVMGQMVVTSEKAKQLNDDLQRVDQKIMHSLLEHNEQSISRVFDASEAFPLNVTKIGSKLIKPTKRKTLQGLKSYVEKVYKDLFDLDIYLSSQQAVDLKLIDCSASL